MTARQVFDFKQKKCILCTAQPTSTAVPAYLYCRACLPLLPCLPTSTAVPAYLYCRACLPLLPCLPTPIPVPASEVYAGPSAW
jgi:hypothetical protein